MSTRLTSLRRIQAVQKKLVDLGTWRVAMAEKVCNDLEADQARLREFMTVGEPIGAVLAKAALRSTASLEQRRARAEQLRRALVNQRMAQERRTHVVASMVADAAVVARRDDEDRDLAVTIDAWLASSDASLP